ncbi:MAG: glycosyltransferase family 4 protein [Deltaproteobacteria bacterium]|nr:glycosyltransferase family 4 protein [Deltaproteobacteria bacterium]
MTARLLLALQERGHEVAVITDQTHPSLPAEGQYKGIQVSRLPFILALTARRVDQIWTIRQQVAKLKRTFAPDLIHVNNVDSSVLFHLDTRNAHPAPVVVTLHGDHGQFVKRETLLEKTLASATWVTGCSAWVVEYLRRLMPSATSRSSLIYNGLDAPSLPPTPLPLNPPRLLCLGRLSAEKRFDLAVGALPAIIKRVPQARLVIAVDGPEQRTLKEQAAQLGLTNAIDFLGWITPESVPPLINTATLVVVPSRREGFGLVALEAAHMARPIVATRVGGLPEVVVHGQTGLLVEQGNAKALADAVIRLLTHPDLAIQLGQAARNRARARFSWDPCVDAYDKLYRTVTKDSSDR